MKQFTAILDGGGAGAAAPLAEIEAFRRRWKEVLRHAFTFMRDPTAARVGNSLADMINLVAVVGFETGGWSDIQREVSAIRKYLLSKKKLKMYAEDGGEGGFSQLLELAKSKGKAEYVWDSSYYTEEDEKTRDERAETTWLACRRWRG